MTARRAGWCWTWIRPTPLHGQQGRRFFHGYYDSYRYLPLYVFCGRHLLCMKLRCKAPPLSPSFQHHRNSPMPNRRHAATLPLAPTMHNKQKAHASLLPYP